MNIFKCPGCGSAIMAPLETDEGDWDDDHNWTQDEDANIYRLTIGFICENKHATVVEFTFDDNKVYNSVKIYNMYQEVEGGIASLTGEIE